MLIDDLLRITKEAGEIVKEGFGTAFQVEFKTNESNLVTEIDKKSEDHIVDFITKEYSNHTILAEEGGEVKKSGNYVWVIDPLDGTTNFAHGLPIFSVSIGIMKDENIIAGAVYDVMRDVMYAAESGAGSYANNRKITVGSQDNLARSVLVTGFPYDIAENPYNALEIFTALTKKARGIRRLGSAAIDFCYLADGVFDGFWEVHLHPWDICAGKLIVEEAGGKVTDFQGNDIDIFSKQILSSNGSLHEELLKLIHEAQK
jgi:myo-inositol-1(or 4)-monophosphatase